MEKSLEFELVGKFSGFYKVVLSLENGKFEVVRAIKTSNMKGKSCSE